MYLGVKLGIYPPLIFIGIGTMTDFGPLIANPKSILLGAAAQFGVFFTFLGALVLGAVVPSSTSALKRLLLSASSEVQTVRRLSMSQRHSPRIFCRQLRLRHIRIWR